MSLRTVPWVISAGLSLVVLFWFISIQRQKAANMPAPTPISTVIPQPTQTPTIGSVDTSHKLVAEGASALFVADQRPGEFVTVSTVFLATPGYIVIHEIENGQPGEVLGVSRYIQSNADMIQIPLDELTVPGNSYIAALYSDDGNMQWDGTEVDTQITFNEAPVQMTFIVSEESEDPPAVAF